MSRSGLLVLLFAATALVLAGASSAWAAVVQITDNEFDDRPPQLDRNHVVWSTHDGNDWEIFLYDMSTGVTTQITDNAYDDERPRIDRGQVVWRGFDGDYWDNYLYDAASGITVNTTNHLYTGGFPEIHGGKVVWYGWDGADYEIYLYEAATGTTTQLTNNSIDDWSPQIFQDQVTWAGGDTAESQEIYFHDVSNGSTIQVTDNAVLDSDPWIRFGRVAWQRDDGTDTDVYLWDVATGETTQLTNNVTNDLHPKVSRDRVVWTGWDGSDWEVYLYSIAGRDTIKLTDNTTWDADADIFQEDVVWSGYDETGTDLEIYHYDATLAQTTQLTNNSYRDDEWPQVRYGRVAWQGWDGTDNEIFLWEEDPPPPTTSTTSTTEPGGTTPTTTPTTSTTSTTVPPAPTVPDFSDVPKSHEFYPAIMYLAGRGIVSGYADGSYGLYDNVLRAQLAKMVVGAYQHHTPAVDNQGNPTFSDVTPSMGVPYPFDYVEEGAGNGIIYGYSDDTFRPYTNLTRIQLVRIIVRSAGAGLANPPGGYSTGFTDVPAADMAAVAKAKYNGLVSGTSASTFNPYGSATRGHIAKILYNALMKQ